MNRQHVADHGGEPSAFEPPAPGHAGSDSALVARAQAGDQTGFERLMRRYNQRLFRVARSVLADDAEAEDAVQEAYVRAFLNLGAYRDQGTFAAWLTRIAFNEALMRKRKNRRSVPMDSTPAAHDRPDAPVSAAATGPEQSAANAQLADLIETAVDSLPVNFRTVFVLRAIEQLSIRDTAAALDIPEATVKTRFHRARGLMRRELNRHIEAAGMNAFDFAGARCDRMVYAVLSRLGLRAPVPLERCH